MNPVVTGRRRLVGPLAFVSGIQYFVVQLVVGLRFSPGYSLATNTISDLGNTSCSRFNGRLVCSPLHALMNGSFIVLGLAMVVGSYLLLGQYPKSRGTTIGLGLFALGGLGALLVGFFPENTVPALHGLGAALPFLFGNAGLVILGRSMRASQPVRALTFLTGAISLLALGVYVSGHYGPFGEGGLERVVAYPQTLWMIAIGIYGCLTPGPP
jgi:hypothetical membrane protein